MIVLILEIKLSATIYKGSIVIFFEITGGSTGRRRNFKVNRGKPCVSGMKFGKNRVHYALP